MRGWSETRRTGLRPGAAGGAAHRRTDDAAPGDHTGTGPHQEGARDDHKSLEPLDGLREKLQEQLEEELDKAELRWGSNDIPSNQFMQLRLAAQKLADQLSQVEELEARLERMLEGNQATGPSAPLPLPTPQPPRLSQSGQQGPEP